MIVIRDKLYINTNELGFKVSKLCELFTYKNPDYMEKKRLKLSVKNIQEFLFHYKIETIGNNQMLVLPRGGLDRVKQFYLDNNLTFEIKDKRISHRKIDIELLDTKLEEQQLKVIGLLTDNEGGLIEAPPAMGKTISMLGLIAKIKQPTLILVHEFRLSNQWIEQIKKRLSGKFELGIINGDVKQDGDIVIGIINSLHNLYKEDPKYFDKFGMIITDECLDPETIITVPNGLKKLKDIKIGDVVITPTGTTQVKNIWKTIKPAYKYTVSNNNYLIASEDHIIATYKYFNQGPRSEIINNSIKNCKGVLYLKTIPKERQIPKFNIENYLYGLFIGDGTCDGDTIKFCVRKEEKIALFDKINNEYKIFNKFINTLKLS